MKIRMYYSGIGPSSFLKRLRHYLVEKYAVKIADDKEVADICLTVPWAGRRPNARAVIVRVDGVYLDPRLHSASSMNRAIQSRVRKSTAVIYQSIYSQKSVELYLRTKAKKSIVIYNGFDRSVYKGIPVNKLGYSKMIVGCALWRPIKRPLSIARGFLKADLPNTVLVMIGAIERKHMVRDPRIKYLGKTKPDQIYQYYKSADALIHISRLDACPNSVVEALSAGVPVVCNNVSGTPEIVRNDGIVLNIDPPLTYSKISLKKPDKVKSSIVAEGIRKCLDRQWKIDRPDLDMSVCAERYYSYFCQILKC